MYISWKHCHFINWKTEYFFPYCIKINICYLSLLCWNFCTLKNMISLWWWILVLNPVCTSKTFLQISDLLLQDIMIISSPVDKKVAFSIRAKHDSHMPFKNNHHIKWDLYTNDSCFHAVLWLKLLLFLKIFILDSHTYHKVPSCINWHLVSCSLK